MSNIRYAKKEDINDILDLLSEVLEIHANGRPDIFKKGSTKYTEEELLEIINNKNTPVFVYEENEKVLGYTFLILKEHSSNNMVYRKECFIDDFCVSKNHRRKGIGKKLYENVKDFAIKNDYGYVTLNVWALNPNALKFYETMGLKPLEYKMEEIL